MAAKGSGTTEKGWERNRRGQAKIKRFRYDINAGSKRKWACVKRLAVAGHGRTREPRREEDETGYGGPPTSDSSVGEDWEMGAGHGR